MKAVVPILVRIKNLRADRVSRSIILRAAAFRSHFPIFQDGMHLCSCSEGALSDRAMVSMSEFMTGRRVHAAPWELWMEEVDRARRAFAQLIRADAKDIAVVSCALGSRFNQAGDDYPNDLEFPSLAHVWLAARSRGTMNTSYKMHH